jgi:hypothetical protein
MESGYVKIGSDMLLMQLASGFTAGLSKKVRMTSFGQMLAEDGTGGRPWTVWPTPGNRKKKLLLDVCAASIPLTGGEAGSYSPCKIRAEWSW